MYLKRVMPCLLMSNGGLYKTVKFSKPVYIGDPINAVKIFNEKEVDELVLLDISATKKKLEPNYRKIAEIASEAFMPFTYGGGINSLEIAKKLYSLGVKNLSLNYYEMENPKINTDIAKLYGNQAVVVSIDVKKNFFGKHEIKILNGEKSVKKPLIEYCKKAEELGAGEILINSIDRDGTWQGFDLDLIKQVVDAVSIPVIACGGAGNIDHLSEALNEGRASALAVGSMAVFQKKGMGVLINFPERQALDKILKI